MKSLFVSTFLTLMLSTMVQAQSFWTTKNIPLAGEATDIVAIPTTTIIVAATTRNGLWRSTNSGTTWSQVNTGGELNFNDLEIAPSGTIYATTLSPSVASIYKSTDNGLNFSNMTPTGMAGSFSYVEALPSGTLIGVAGSIVQASVDGGVSFATRSTLSSTIFDIETDANGVIVVGVSNGGVLYSSNEGISFTQGVGITSTFTGIDITSNGSTWLAFTTQGPYKSIDNGANWSSINGNLPSTTFYSGMLKVSSNGSLLLFDNNSKIFYTSADGGTTWSSIATEADGAVYNMVIVSPAFWIVCTSRGLFKSIDSGVTWSVLNKLFQFSDVYYDSDGYIFVAGVGTQGYAWAMESNLQVEFGMNLTTRPITNFVGDANDIYAYSKAYPGLLRSSNNGANWSEPNSVQTLTNLALSAGTLYSVSGSDLLISTDGGTTWPASAISGLAGSVTELEASTTDGFLLALTSIGGLYRIDATNPASVSATSIIASGAQDMAVADGAVFVLASTTSLRKSTDNAATFTSKTLPSSFAMNRIWAFDSQNILGRSSTANNYAVNISNNSGTSWKQVPLLDKFAGVAVEDVAFTNRGRAFPVVTNSNLYYSNSPIAPPHAPTNLKVLINLPNAPSSGKPQSGQFGFQFDDLSNNEDYFVLERSADNTTWDSVGNSISLDNNRQLIDDVTQTITQGSAYFFRVKAVNGGGSSSYSNTLEVTLNSYCDPTIPDNRSWSAVASADPGFTASGPGPFESNNVLIVKDPNTASSYTVSDLLLGVVPASVHPDWGQQTASIYEGCGIVNTFYSDQQTELGSKPSTWDPVTKTLTVNWMSTQYYPQFEGTTVYTLNAEDPAPQTPVLGAFVYSATETFLAWKGVTFASDYIIQRSLVSGDPEQFETVAIVQYPTTSYIDKGLQTNTYYYQISAFHRNGPTADSVSSAWSAEAAVQLGPTLFRPFETDLNQNLDNQQGSSWADLDNDGDEDLVLCTFSNILGQNVPPSFFENLGQANLKRKDLDIVAADGNAVSRAAGIVDFDNDGRLDIYFDRGGDDNDYVLINKGNWVFEKLLVHEDITGSAIENLAMGDIDKDSFVDFYVGTANDGTSLPSVPNYLIKNLDGTAVEQVTTGPAVETLTSSRSASFADYDNDGDLDLLALNYQHVSFTPLQPQRLFQNDGSGNFTMVTGSVFDTDLIAMARTSSWGDIDNDGDLDLFIGSQSQTPGTIAPSHPQYDNYAKGYDRLYRNDNGTFVSLVSSEVAAYSTGTFGSAFGDIDNDGDLDLLVSNQYGGGDYRGESAIFTNDGTGTFTKVITDELFTNKYIVTAGISLADVDKDGFLDVFPVKGSSFGSAWPGDDIPNLLYKSTLTPSASRNWIQIKLRGTISNAAAIGARITVTTALAAPLNQQIREVAGMTGYGSQNSLVQHFGLKNATTCNITVKWPSGLIQTLNNVSSNQFITISEDNTGPVVASTEPANGAVAVAFDASLKITFDEVPVPIAGKKIKIYLATDLVTPVQTLDVSSGSVSGKTFTIAQSGTLQANKLYKAVIDNSAFKDIYGNIGTFGSEAWEFTSLDVTPPVFGTPATTYLAEVGGGFVSTIFSATATDNVSVATITMYHRPKGSTDPYSTLAGALNVNTNAWDFTVLESFYSSTGLEFYFVAADPDGNSTTEPSSGTLSSLVETSPPTLTIGSYPSLIYKGYGTVGFGVTASDNYSVATATMYYRNTKDGVNYIAVAGTPDGTVVDQYNFSVPESGFNGEGIEFYFTASDPSGNSTRNPADPDVVTLMFESTAPTLDVPTFAATIAKGFGSFAMNVTATDNVGISTVVLSYKNLKDGTSYTTTAGTADPNVANRYNFSLPETTLKGVGVEYFFTAKDATGNSTRHPADPEVLTLLLETTPPVIVVPTNEEMISKGFGTKEFRIQATDNFSVASVQMFYRNTKDGVNFLSSPGVADQIELNTYIFTIQEASFNDTGLEYYFVATDGTGNSVRAPLESDTPSTFEMLIDNEAPAITPFTAPASLAKANTTFTVKVTDNLEVGSVVMKYRGIASQSFTTSNPGTLRGVNDFDFGVQAGWFDDMGLEYYFRAVDASGNVSVYPDTTAATNKYLRTFVKFEGDALPELNLIKGSTGASGYQVISIPLELSNKNIADNFEELGTADKTAYRFLRYRATPSPGWDEYPGGNLSIITRGEGYFLNSIKAEKITLLSGIAPTQDKDNLFELKLLKGWNQIGNPYTVQIRWSDVIAFNNNPTGVSVKLTKYDNGYNTNDPDGIIEPYKGGFVEAAEAITLKVPFIGQTTGGRLMTPDADLNKQNWELPIRLVQGDVHYNMARIGMNERALNTKDEFDLPAVPRLEENFIEAVFFHPDQEVRVLSQDIVETSDYHEWTMQVASALNATTTLVWDSESLGEGDRQLFLLDLTQQTITDMREQSSYSFDPMQSSKFRIFYGDRLSERIKPLSVNLSTIFPNPSTGLVNIRYAVPDTGGLCGVSLEIFDSMGKRISTVVKENQVGGFYAVQWDATDSETPSGVYLCRLTVNGTASSSAHSQKIVLKK